MRASEIVLIAEQRWRVKNRAKVNSLKIDSQLVKQSSNHESGLNSGPVIAILELPRRQMLIDGDSDKHA